MVFRVLKGSLFIGLMALIAQDFPLVTLENNALLMKTFLQTPPTTTLLRKLLMKKKHRIVHN